MTDSMPPKNQPPRWQAEIEEILEKSDRDSTSFEKARAAAIATRYKAPGRAKLVTERVGLRLGSGIWLVLAVSVGIAAWVAGLHSPLIGRVLAGTSLLLFIALLISAVASSRKQRAEPKLWRGRDLGVDSPPAWRAGGKFRRDDDDDPPLVGSGR